MHNIYGIYFEEKGLLDTFAFNWLGAKVKTKVFGTMANGVVKGVDSSYKTLDVELVNKQDNKIITVSGHFNCFRKV